VWGIVDKLLKIKGVVFEMVLPLACRRRHIEYFSLEAGYKNY
jgi:hypothetical protein